MSFFSKFFKSKDNSDNQPEIDPTTEAINEPVEQDPNVTKDQVDDMPCKDNYIPEDLPSAIRHIIATKGEDILSEQIFINILDDYHLFTGQRFIKNALRQLQQGDYIDKILSSANWELDSKSLIIRMTSEYGIQTRIASFIILSVGYGFGHTNEKPYLEEESVSSPEPIDSPLPVIEHEDNQPLGNFDCKSMLPNYSYPDTVLFENIDDTTLYKTLGDKDLIDCKIPVIMQDVIDLGVPMILDLVNGPHVLIAGTTLSGKSMLIHSMIASMLFKKHPTELQLVLMDGNGLELSQYEKLNRHFIAKLPDVEEDIITKPQNSIDTLNALCTEIDNRWELFKNAKARNIEVYNEKFCQRKLNPVDGHRYLPYIVVVIDEYNPFMQYDTKAFEAAIAKIGQKGATVGLHMIISTNQVTKEVLTQNIRIQFPCRFVFKTNSVAASRLILNNGNAVKLPPRGKYLWGGEDGETSEMTTPVSTDEGIEKLTDFISGQQGFVNPYLLPESLPEFSFTPSTSSKDPLFDDAARLVVKNGVASTSSIQRYFSIGYNRSGLIMDQLERAGIVGPSIGVQPRKILVDTQRLEALLLSL